RIPVRSIAALLLCILAAPAPGGDEPWFVNASRESGLEGVRAKDCILTDLDGDGYWDLCLDRQRLYRSDRGRTFAAHEEHGIAFPVAKRIPITRDGKPDLAKAKEGPYVPQYLYFADLDNDGDQDAVWGVHTHWEHFDGRNWIRVEKCDPGLRSTVYLNDGKGRFRRAPESPFTSRGAAGPAMALAILDY
ncbi:MAG: VCBS repeat-containing protein, partial [Phycisphaeraceae bacterium]|nr:VCBS repeat-containing protein [Phycisphaeraceae bacterium]